MASQNPTDPPRTSTGPARRRRAPWGMRVTDPATSTDSGFRAAWGIAAFLVVIVNIVAAMVLGDHQSRTSSTATSPSTTQSAPSSTGQGGAANTGAAR